MSDHPVGEAKGEDFPCFGGPFDGATVPWSASPSRYWAFPLASMRPSLTLRLTELAPPLPPIMRRATYRMAVDPDTGAIRYVYEGTEDR